MSTENTPRVRPRTALKRAAILSAAHDLFLADGYERTSVDSISARADVSKRTVYDHFGDKESLFSAVVTAATESLLATIKVAIDEELADDHDLDQALLGFARRIATDTFSSSDYAVLRKLRAGEGPRLPVSGSPQAAPETMLVERFETFARTGRIQTTNPRRATEHFIALTFLLALNSKDLDSSGAFDSTAVDRILIDGVDAFMRAYAPR
jgi:TetR/AcrR family transcriptional repressor of mexJK operon